MLAGILLALASALCFAAAGALQHSVTSAVARASVPASKSLLPVLGMLPRMLSQRVWWAGFACNVGGFGLHSMSLHLGSITIVQALLSVQLLFALPLATARARTLPLGRDWTGTAAVCAGLVMLVTARGSVPQTQSRHYLVPIVCLLGLAFIAALLVTARFARDTTRTAFTGTAAGTGFSLTAVLIIVVADQIVHGGAAVVFSHWHVYGLATSGLLAAILAQDAFASGSFPAALTAMTVADPVVSWVWGAILFDAVPPANPVALGSLAISGLLITAGVALLAYSPTMARPA